ncbi:MAG: hypothetical protein ABI591_00355 [Kofleriaceae bacterium]
MPPDPGHAAGWDDDSAALTLTIYGSSCDRLRDHRAPEINVSFGCPSPPIL